MSGLLDALFRGLRGDTTPPIKETKEPTSVENARRANTETDDGVATQSETGDSEKENTHDITGLSADPEDALPIVMSPIRSGDESSSFDTTTSTIDSAAISTPGVDVSFGPQGTPYVIRRRNPLGDLTTDTPSRAPHNTPDSTAWSRARGSRSAAISIRHPDDSIEEVDHVVEAPTPATAWRQEQVKYVRKARYNPNVKPKNIPTLQGPLSLPYARNPSGVDAIITDDTPYLDNGRPRHESFVKLHPPHAFRIASDGSNKFGNETFGKTEPFKHGPMIFDTRAPAVPDLPAKVEQAVFNEGKGPEDTPMLVDLSIGSTEVARSTEAAIQPIVRDPKQMIAIRDSAAVEIKDPKVKKVIETAKAASRIINADVQKATESTKAVTEAAPPPAAKISMPASMILRSQAKPATSVNAPAAADPFDGLYNAALASAAGQKQTQHDDWRPTAENGFTPSYADLKAIWAAATEHYARQAAEAKDSASPNTSRAASDESTVSASLSFPAGAFSTPVKIPNTTVVSSKADTSANWRNKGMEMTTPGGREIPAIAVTSPTMVEGNSSTMTIDSLFQKFTQQEQAAAARAIPRAKPSDPAIKEVSETPMKPTKTIKPVRSPLGEAKSSTLNSVLKKANAGSKGTPNAGKLLKKKVEITEAPQMSAKAKGKQKMTEGAAKLASA